MRPVHDVAAVREAERALMERVPDGELMSRASLGLADLCWALIEEADIEDPRVCLLVGSGNNGGDALFAGAELARRGARLDAVVFSDTPHDAGFTALRLAGGRHIPAKHTMAASERLVDADLVIDGIVGIGGSGALRPVAAELLKSAYAGGAIMIAADIPSGVEADTGRVADPEACVNADLTVTFGCYKPGLLLAPGRDHCGAVALVDIGLDATLPPATVHVLDEEDIADCVPEPGPEDYKYSRGVVGIAAGSAAYRGAALMCTGAARYGNVGMVHFLDRGDGIAQVVVDHFWDVVAGSAAPASLPRVTAWAVGPGLGTDPGALDALGSVLAAPVPVLLDADALHLVAEHDLGGELRRRLSDGHPTVLTPHQGEFAALGYSLAPGDDRLAAARRAARDLGCVMVLKGPGTIVASPAGAAYLDDRAGAELGTAGSGDVLSGLIAALLAGAAARSSVDSEAAAIIAAAGVALHGMAGSIAAEGGRPVTAPDVISALPDAVGAVRRGRAW